MSNVDAVIERLVGWSEYETRNDELYEVEIGALRALVRLAIAVDFYEKVIAVDGRSLADGEYAKVAGIICEIRNAGILSEE